MEAVYHMAYERLVLSSVMPSLTDYGLVPTEILALLFYLLLAKLTILNTVHKSLPRFS